VIIAALLACHLLLSLPRTVSAVTSYRALDIPSDDAREITFALNNTGGREMLAFAAKPQGGYVVILK